MSKFRRGDSVRIINPEDTRYDTVGTITHHEPDSHYAYDVTFPDGFTTFYRSTDLLLAPGDHE